jgi:AcrR family transcriptional regulator
MSDSTTLARPVRPPRTQAERTEDTRGRILDAAVDMLTTHGYSGFRTAPVAARAGVSRGALTYHFPSRDELLLAVVAEVFRRAGEAGRARARTVQSVDEAIAQLLADSRDFFFSELFLVAMDLAIQGRLADSPVNAVASISAAARLPVESSWLDALTASGVPAPVAEDLLWLTNSIVRGLAVRRLWQDDPPRFQRLFGLWRQMVAAYLATLSPATPPAG